MKKTAVKLSLTYIITALLFGVIIYFLPGYQDTDPEIAYNLSFILCIGLGFGFMIYFLYAFVLFLFSLYYKKPIRLFIRGLLCLAIFAVFFISLGGSKQENRLKEVIQTFAITTLFFCVPYIESIVLNSNYLNGKPA